MSNEEAIFYQEQAVASEVDYLNSMIDSNYIDDELIEACVRFTRTCMVDYKAFKEEGKLVEAEEWQALAVSLRKQKYKIGDIRKQREKIWQEKKRLQTMTTQRSEPKPSSVVSET